MLILTVIPPTVKVSRAVLDHCCFLLSQKLADADEVSANVIIVHMDCSRLADLLDRGALHKDADSRIDIWECRSAPLREAAPSGDGRVPGEDRRVRHR